MKLSSTCRSQAAILARAEACDESKTIKRKMDTIIRVFQELPYGLVLKINDLTKTVVDEEWVGAIITSSMIKNEINKGFIQW